ncbi:hypothetical protein PAXRUDRAFT_17080 [Paxillus rubicundulus Ve08.2h10]|uniref:Uncharacterized protein n=1 Tax=Paxillus rubicundulus Ve08.2h10 TaxID=930991 RepID=A0A0D0DBS1_9AGAM|nr:hypothetical protein PAXRUDRAFT_17080 [Paxillus rubicundulus Ve08.2h10]
MSAYELVGEEREQYKRTIMALSRIVPLWPPIPTVRVAGQKWRTVKMLEMAALANNWNRPSTKILLHPCEIPRDTVLKCSHSDCGEYVIMPEWTVAGSTSVDIAKHTEIGKKRAWLYLEAHTHSPEEQWASQEYVETLVTLGEWRFFLVGGHVENIVHTIKGVDGNWTGKWVCSFLQLSELRDLWTNRHAVPVTADVIVNPDSGDQQIRQEAMNQVLEVVDTSYRELVRQETNCTGAKSTLCVLCHIDIGLMFDKDGNPSYFVNEVERTPTMSLWLRTVGDANLRRMVDTFRRVLHNHLTELGQAYRF